MVSFEELRKSGGRVQGIRGVKNTSEQDRFAMKIVGILADASTNSVRLKAIDKARKMIRKK